jgi:prepilin-type N-terminal cleavage/methylation domain-containing protein
MQKQKGFTIVEVLIVIVIVVIIGLILLTIGRAMFDPSYNYCDSYRYSSFGDVPVSCVDYLTNGAGKQQ